MERRKFTREFKLEAVRLIRERGVTVAQAARSDAIQTEGGSAFLRVHLCDASETLNNT